MVRRLALITGLTLSLAACGGGSSSTSGNAANNSEQKTDLVQTETAAPQATAEVGSAVTTKDGLSITVTPLAKTKPGKFATGLVSGNVNNAFSIKATNGGTAEANLTGLIVTVGDGADVTCADILDADNGFAGAPMDPLAPGASVEFKWAVSCTGKSGAAVTVDVSVDGVNLVDAKGKLA